MPKKIDFFSIILIIVQDSFATFRIFLFDFLSAQLIFVIEIHYLKKKCIWQLLRKPYTRKVLPTIKIVTTCSTV